MELVLVISVLNNTLIVLSPNFANMEFILVECLLLNQKKTEPEPELVEIVNISSVGTFMSAKV